MESQAVKAKFLLIWQVKKEADSQVIQTVFKALYLHLSLGRTQMDTW
jgi:hypothetical protein